MTTTSSPPLPRTTTTTATTTTTNLTSSSTATSAAMTSTTTTTTTTTTTAVTTTASSSWLADYQSLSTYSKTFLSLRLRLRVQVVAQHNDTDVRSYRAVLEYVHGGHVGTYTCTYTCTMTIIGAVVHILLFFVCHLLARTPEYVVLFSWEHTTHSGESVEHLRNHHQRHVPLRGCEDEDDDEEVQIECRSSGLFCRSIR